MAGTGGVQAAHDVLREDHRQALAASQHDAGANLRRVLARAARELESRILGLEARGMGETFTAVRAKATLAQIHQVVRNVQRGLQTTLVDGAPPIADKSAQTIARYLAAADKAFRGVGRTPLRIEEASLMDAARTGVQSSLLRRIAHDPDHPGRPGVLERYGVATIAHFEEALQKGVIAHTPWEDMKKDLIDRSPFLQGAPRYWAERIVRTELMGVQNRAGWEAIRATDDQLGDMLKILSATFDDRTSADSFAVHGQIRRPEEAFQSWWGLYQHPPNRPNDREIVVPHRKSWPIPPYLTWRTDGEVQARWEYEGRKGKCPARPKMTTVPLAQIGVAAPTDEASERATIPAPPPAPPVRREIPAERFHFHGPPPVPPVPRMEVPPIPDMQWQRDKVEKVFAKDTALAEQSRDGSARDDWEGKAFKKLKPIKGSKYDVTLPWRSEEVREQPPHGMDVETLRAELDIGRHNIPSLPRERVLVDEFVPRTNVGDRWHVERAILELTRNREAVAAFPGGQDLYMERPVVFRIGDKLYPLRSYDNFQFAAAKAAGFGTLDAHVVDVNQHLAKKAATANERINERMRPREAAHEREVARVTEAVRRRVEREHEGDDDIVAIRTKHQPADYLARHDRYLEAAPSVAWGHAMHERGLDFPITHLHAVVKSLPADHPFRALARQVLDPVAESAATIREYLDLEGVSPDTKKAANAAAAILAHADAVRGHDGFNVTQHADAVGPEHETRQKMAWLAALTDQSVSLPDEVLVDLAKNGRAECSTYGIITWKDRRAFIKLAKHESTGTVFHELGHAIEASDRGRGVRASAFLDRRTAHQEYRPLKELTGNNGYRPDEIARPDAFASEYVGKDYGRNEQTAFADRYFGDKSPVPGVVADTDNTHRATEVTSMAIEHLGRVGSGTQWANAFERDPEHLYFGLGQLGGY